MAKVKYDYTDVDESGGTYDGDEPKPAIYTGKVVGAEVGKSSAGNPMITVQIDITEGEFKGWRGWHYLVQTPESLWKTKEFTDALGLTTPGRKSGTWDTDKAVGKVCRIKTKREMYEGEAKAKIKSVLAVKAKDADDEDPADDAAADETPATDDAADPDVWTWDDLQGKDRDELKQVVKDEQLDPKELGLSKDMDDDEIRTKIAEALGVDVPTDDADGSDPDDPF